VVAGALGLTSLLRLLFVTLGAPPRWVIVLTVILAMVTLTGWLPAALPRANWVVPKSWGHHGYASYSMLFGVALGVGFATVLPSPALYVVAVYACSLPNFLEAFTVVGLFALTRAAIVPIVALTSGRMGCHPADTLRRLNVAQPSLRALELGLLSVLAVLVWV